MTTTQRGCRRWCRAGRAAAELLANLEIPARDGFALAATAYTGAAAPSYVALFAPATGVKRSLYRALAEYVVERNAASLTWDWRGTGGST